MNKQSLSEAFKAMELLNEETFDLDDTNVYDDLQDFIIDDNDNEISIIDMNAETQDDLLDDYVGQVILDCCVCHSKIYKDKDEIVIDDETQCANIDEECPYCSSMDGFKIIGEVAPYSETEVEVEVEEKDEDEDEIDDDIETEEEKETVEESLKSKKLNESQPRNKLSEDAEDIADRISIFLDKTSTIEDLSDYLDSYDLEHIGATMDALYDFSHSYFLNESQLKFVDNRKNAIIKGEGDYGFDEYDYEEDETVDESLNEDLTIIANIDNYEPWGEAEKTYREIENAGMLADFEDLMEELYPDGIEMGRLNDILWFNSEEILSMLGLWEPDPDDDGDQYDECMKTENCKENDDENEVNESIENIDIETEHEKIKVKTEEKEDHDNEMIVPVETETEDEIEAEQIEDEPEDEEMVDVDFDEFDEETFDNIGESYLKKVYENVDSYKTSEVKLSKDNKIVIEGLIKFNSGNVKKTSFIFESKDMTKAGKLRFIGENCQISRGKKSFTLTGNLTNKKFISEALNYNYKTKNSDGKSTRVYGTQRIK